MDDPIGQGADQVEEKLVCMDERSEDYEDARTRTTDETEESEDDQVNTDHQLEKRKGTH